MPTGDMWGGGPGYREPPRDWRSMHQRHLRELQEIAGSAVPPQMKRCHLRRTRKVARVMWWLFRALLATLGMLALLGMIGQALGAH